MRGIPPKRRTAIDYYRVIHHPITDYKTVQQCLLYAREATKEVGQKYTITTFDLGVCMKAYPIIFNHPERFKKHIVLIGTFHLTMAYFKMLGKKLEGSGIEDIILEAGLSRSESIQAIMTGKIMNVHFIAIKSL